VAIVVTKTIQLYLPFYQKITGMKWHIGCSGFYYKHWRGKFYPEDLPQKKWFDFYCEHFRSLEMNGSFYRFPRVPFLKSWHERSPADFKFSIKAPKAITHYKQFHNSVDMISSFYDTIRAGLQEKLGPVLFQVPERFRYDEDRLQRVIANLDPTFKNVFEPRHESWWREDVFEELGMHHIAFCGMSHPDLPKDVVVNAPLLYYRFHGVPDLYRSPYSHEELQQVVDTVKSNKKVKEAYFYFNNDIEVLAVDNAKDMTQMIEK